MTKDVLVSVAGLRYDTEDAETIEVINRGEYYYRNGKHYILYDELSEEVPSKVTKCVLKLSKDKIEMIKNGDNRVHMKFEVNSNNFSCYSTPFGELMLGINTTAIDLKESERVISADLKYNLDINYEHVGNCDLKIEVRDTVS